MDIFILLIIILVIGILIIGYLKLKQIDSQLELIDKHSLLIDELSSKLNKLQSKYFISKVSYENFNEKSFDTVSSNSLLHKEEPKNNNKLIDDKEKDIIIDNDFNNNENDNNDNNNNDNNENNNDNNDNNDDDNNEIEDKNKLNDSTDNKSTEELKDNKESINNSILDEIHKIILNDDNIIINDARHDNTIFDQPDNDTDNNNNIKDIIPLDTNIKTDNDEDEEINYSTINLSQINNDILELDNKDNKYKDLIKYLNDNTEKTCKLKDMKLLIINCGIDKINKNYYFLKKTDMFNKLKTIKFIN